VRKAGVAGVVVLVLAVVSCNGDCPRIRQTVVLTSPDANLQALVDGCAAHLPAAGETCAASNAASYPPIDCGCLPLCRRALEIIDQFPGTEAIEDCHYRPPTPPSFDVGMGFGGAGRVDITYRPSTCP
jgi:hypothetical protein